MENGEHLISIAQEIRKWKEEHPTRSIKRLAKQTGVSKAEINNIERGKIPRADTAMKLGAVLPADAVLLFVCASDESYKKFFNRLSRDDDDALI